MDYERLLICIPKGKKNAVGADVLTTLWGCKDTRETRKYVETLRLGGNVILADESGYYQPDNKDEIRQYVHRVTQRIRTASATLKSAKDALKDVEGQLTIDDSLDNCLEREN